MSPRRLGAAALVVAAAIGPLPPPTADAAPAAAAAPRAGATSPDGEPRAPYPRSVGLPAAVALVALGGSTAALLRVLRSGPPRGSGYPGPLDASTLLSRRDRDRQSRGGGSVMRHYELMVILDPELEERTVAPSLDQFLNVVRQGGGRIEKVDIWGRRRLAYEIGKKPEGIYAVVDLHATPDVMQELDRQLNLNESVVRTKVIRPEK